MGECSQKFQDMLSEYGGDCRNYGYNDGCRPEPSEDAILQYVAELEAIRDKVREVVGPLATDMVGGMP